MLRRPVTTTPHRDCVVSILKRNTPRQFVFRTNHFRQFPSAQTAVAGKIRALWSENGLTKRQFSSLAAYSNHSGTTANVLFDSSSQRGWLSTVQSASLSMTNYRMFSNAETTNTSSAAAILNDKQLVSDPSHDDLLRDLERAAAWNQGNAGKIYDESLWDIQFCRDVVRRYDAFLEQQKQHPFRSPLLNPEPVIFALKGLLKCNYEATDLSPKVRSWERIIGTLRQTPFTDHVSLRFLTAHAKSGNVANVMRLLQLRSQRGFRPRDREFAYAVTSLQAVSALQARNRSNRSPYLPEAKLTLVERNPTRWLDAILRNMKEREFDLTPFLAKQMLKCFCSTGYSGKATHHFYRIIREPSVVEDEEDDHDLSFEQIEGNTDCADNNSNSIQKDETVAKIHNNRKFRLCYNADAPHFFKRPSEVKNKLVFPKKRQRRNDNHDSNSHQSKEGLTRLDIERNPKFSETLSAAFSFADSLQHGVCGHAPIRFNTALYNALVEACVKHGAFCRALYLIDTVMPQNDCAPNIISYNLLLTGLARVGDVVTIEEYYYKLLSSGSCTPDAFTVRAIVNGLLNNGDVPGAVTIVPDMFHQHSVLPPYTTHLKILEFCLALKLVHEAKRYVYFLQELWHWKPNKYHSKEFIKLMKATQQNDQLQKPALQQLFAYFGETLDGFDFL